MLHYTADTVARITATRRPPAPPRAPREDTRPARAAAILRAIADRLDGPTIRTTTGTRTAGC